jgi:hypothetical protein
LGMNDPVKHCGRDLASTACAMTELSEFNLLHCQ